MTLAVKIGYIVDISCSAGLLYEYGQQRLGTDWIWAVEIGFSWAMDMAAEMGYRFDMGSRDRVPIRHGL